MEAEERLLLPEIWLEVISNLQAADLCSLALVSR